MRFGTGRWRRSASKVCTGGGGACAVLPLAVLVACAGGPAEDPGVMRITGTVRVGERTLSGPVQTGEPVVELHRPFDIIVLGDSVYVVDNGNDRLVVLDRRLRVLGVIGRDGEGPGEFLHPTSVRRSPGGVTTVDMGNARFTEFDRSGRVVRTYPAEAGLTQFAMSESGAAYIRSVTRKGQYMRINGDAREDLGIWPHPTPPGREAPLLPEDQAVQVTAGDTVHVLDEQDLVLYKYDPAGTLLIRRKLPQVVRDSAFGGRDRLVKAFTKQGHTVVGASVSGDFEVTSGGDLLLLIKAGPIVGLLIDPHTYEARQLVARQAADGSVSFSYWKGALVDSTLYVLSNYEVAAFRIEGLR